jgi:AcrR family transcriptional regulator
MPRKNYHHGDLKNALIKAGIEILSKEGMEGLSLRKVAQKAGVSHSAPYAHFSDKQSLIAAISTEGFNQLYAELDAAVLAHPKEPKKQLQDGARAYVRFALNHTDTFKIMFSGVLEKEKDYPAFVEISQKTYQRVVDVVEVCQQAGIMHGESAEMMAVAVWGQLHGIVSLALEGQIPHTLLNDHKVEDVVAFAIEQMISVGV